MGCEQFSLCWDNFHKNMSSGMHSLLETEDLVDVTLAVEGKYLKAHKMVLSVCSPYFRELFQMNPCKHPIVFMKDVSYIALSDLLTFMYKGEVQVNQENLGTFIKTAEALQIKGLTGDSNSVNDNEVPEEPEIIETVPKRQVIDTESIKVRPKKFAPPMPGPASKKPKLVVPPAEPNVSFIAKSESTPSPQQIIQFKMEPYETSDPSTLDHVEDSQDLDIHPNDDSHMDDTEDYSLIEGDDEPKAGTSTEAMGDGQDIMVMYGRSKRKQPYMGIVVNGFVYHQNSTKRKSNIRYLVCSEYKRLVCRARAIIPVNGTEEDLILTREHNHPPTKSAERRTMFIRKLKDLVMRSTGCSLRQAYDLAKLAHPEGAEECPFDKINSSMRRWERSLEKSLEGCSEQSSDVKNYDS